ncbi:MAG: PilZ domain-containing protein [Candidatus Omnitrophota bacterium]
MLEKRKHKRINNHIPIRYKKLSAPQAAESTTITKDLCGGGFLFRTEAFISMACRLIIELEIPLFDRPIKAIAKVAWIKKTASGKSFEVGNQILDMSKEDKQLFFEYINTLFIDE